MSDIIVDNPATLAEHKKWFDRILYKPVDIGTEIYELRRGDLKRIAMLKLEVELLKNKLKVYEARCK